MIVEASTPGIDKDTDQFIPAAAKDITARVTQAAFAFIQNINSLRGIPA
ncbi:MAG: hypothetical protein JWQ23_2102 [Herminiimonas sp.]|nr:hypothetical protein [Herminiimonas sp.]